ncbi:MAG: hypothetical protein ACK5RL_05960 [Acidimicrobiales bacterium]
MGLVVAVAVLDDVREADEEAYEYYRDQFARLAGFVAAEGYPGYTEPERIPVHLPVHEASISYGMLHGLRRVFAHVRNGETEVPALAAGEDPAADPLIDRELSVRMDSHLVCHSDAEGYYVPVEFDDVLYPDGASEIAGGMVGSSYRLRDELLLVAPALGIDLGPDGPTPAAAERLAGGRGDASHPLARERIVWWTLWVAAAASIGHGTAITFQ